MRETTADQLARIETEIGSHRALYLRATWAGHQGEAEHHETEVDRLLAEWDQVHRTQAGAVSGA